MVRPRSRRWLSRKNRKATRTTASSTATSETLVRLLRDRIHLLLCVPFAGLFNLRCHRWWPAPSRRRRPAPPRARGTPTVGAGNAASAPKERRRADRDAERGRAPRAAEEMVPPSRRPARAGRRRFRRRPRPRRPAGRDPDWRLCAPAAQARAARAGASGTACRAGAGGAQDRQALGRGRGPLRPPLAAPRPHRGHLQQARQHPLAPLPAPARARDRPHPPGRAPRPPPRSGVPSARLGRDRVGPRNSFSLNLHRRRSFEGRLFRIRLAPGRPIESRPAPARRCFRHALPHRRAAGSKSLRVLRSEFVFVEQTAESVAPADTPLVVSRRDGGRLDERWLLFERAVRPVRVVVRDVLAQNRLELSAGDDEDAVETFTPDAADPTLRVRLRPWRSDRRLDHPDSLRTEDLVEGGREFDVAVADQEPMPLLLVGQGHRQVARLLHDPGAVGIGGDAGEIHATPRQLDEEEHVEPAQPERLDREEVTLDHRGRLLAQELSPADARSPRRGFDPVAVENVPNAACRQGHPERDQLALDALVPPARVLRRQTQNQLPHLRGNWRPALPTPIVCPAATDEVTMPAQQCRRLDQNRPPPFAWQQLAERRQQHTICRAQARTPNLAPQHLQFMPQHQDLKLLRPLRTTKENQQLKETANGPVSDGQPLRQQTSSAHLPTLP